MRRSLTIRWLLVAAALFWPLNAVAEEVRGRSDELGIDFEVAGGANWCAPSVTVMLMAKQPGVFDLEASPFARMVGRIRAVVSEPCPQLERIEFQGGTETSIAVMFEMTRLTGWRRFVPLDTANARQLCRSPDPSPRSNAACEPRIAAYATAHQILRGEDFREAILDDYLDTTLPSHLTWRDGATTGKITTLDADDLLQKFGSLGGMLDAMVGIVAEPCARPGSDSLDVVFEDKDDRSYRAIPCSKPDGAGPFTLAFVARPAVDGGYVLIQVNAPTLELVQRIFAIE